MARKRTIWGGAVALGAVAAAGWIVYGGGRHEGPGRVHPTPRPAQAIAAAAARSAAAGGGAPDQILFGDLHVHTTFSADAFMRSLPAMGGEGAHPPADACDFARYCSQLDFFALTDHAEALTPRHWRESIDAIRACNAVAGDPATPDLVAFMGFEWSQVGATRADHYGHKNVIFRGLSDADLPARPIAAVGLVSGALRRDPVPLWRQLLIPLQDFARRQRYLDFALYQRELRAAPLCPAGVDTRALPADCREVAATPAELFEKLAQWGLESIVIPHGTTWGFYTPPGYTYDKGLGLAEPLIEIYSGHGNSEVYRPWRAVTVGPDGDACPQPTAEYEPCCWRAGEIIRARCGDADPAECDRRVRAARAAYVAAGTAGHLTVPGATVEEWGNCGQCTDCFNAAFNYRPGGSVQYIVSRRGRAIGFVASSDNHSARPGTGYKEMLRRRFGDATGPQSATWRDRLLGEPAAPAPEPRAWDPDELLALPPFRLVELERQASFFMTGGLAAVHARGRDRAAIWDALVHRRVYGTSGDRILLWFDLTNAPGGAQPMGAEVALAEAPRFRVRAAGAHLQAPGCPRWAVDALGPEGIERVCAGECYHPTDQRRRITRIEVVRIRPAASEADVAGAIDDPWRVIPCPAGEPVCEVEFADPDASGDTFYYVRAIQEPTPAVNAGGLRCGPDGCEPCYGDWRTPADDDCLTDNEERAWSSPILVRRAALPAPAAPAGGPR